MIATAADSVLYRTDIVSYEVKVAARSASGDGNKRYGTYDCQCALYGYSSPTFGLSARLDA